MIYKLPEWTRVLIGSVIVIVLAALQIWIIAQGAAWVDTLGR